MLVGFVSDEQYAALADVLLEFQQGEETVAVVRSTPRGAVYAEIAPGEYRVVLAKGGFGAKTVTVHVDPRSPYHFRLLSDALLGYMWPRWVRSGEAGEYRIHTPEECQVSLCIHRCGCLSCF